MATDAHSGRRINSRTKGATGEREVCAALNKIVTAAMAELGYDKADCETALTSIQRNQNQSAVGGADLSNTFGLAIEIKRQERLAVSKWWKQCTEQAARNHETPILMYRQNRGQWRVMMPVWLQLPDSAQIAVTGEVDWTSFCLFFKQWVLTKLQQGAEVRS